MLQGRKRSVLCVCCCDCDRGAVLVVCVVVVVLWCALWSSLALIGVQKHRGVLVCRRGHRKHDNDPQSGGTGAGKYRQNKRQRKFLTSAGFPSVWCLSGVPEGLLIAGDHQTSIQTRGKSNSPPSRSRPRQRGRRCRVRTTRLRLSSRDSGNAAQRDDGSYQTNNTFLLNLSCCVA